MNLDEFEKSLVQIQNNSYENKVLQSIYSLAKVIVSIEDALSKAQNKMNEMIIEINALREQLDEVKENANK